MDAKTKTVLIVEDNELNMKLFHDLLDAHGYNILQTKDGMEALDIAREHRPDLILMDIQLPEVSGHEALPRPARRARLQHPADQGWDGSARHRARASPRSHPDGYSIAGSLGS